MKENSYFDEIITYLKEEITVLLNTLQENIYFTSKIIKNDDKKENNELEYFFEFDNFKFQFFNMKDIEYNLEIYILFNKNKLLIELWKFKVNTFNM